MRCATIAIMPARKNRDDDEDVDAVVDAVADDFCSVELVAFDLVCSTVD